MKNSRIGLIFFLLLLIGVLLVAILYLGYGSLPFLPDVPFGPSATPTLTNTPMPDFAATLEVEATMTQAAYAQETEFAGVELTAQAGLAETAIAKMTQTQVQADIATAVVVVTQAAQATAYAQETDVAFAIALETEQAQATETEIAQLTQAAIATPTPYFEITMREKDDMEMVYVPAGNFSMGAREEDDPARDDEKPMHTVYLDGYYIDRYEITTAQYAAYLNANPTAARWMPSAQISKLQKVNGIWQPRAGYEDHPVMNIIWRGAQDYCNWVGADLPTEAQWEKAARGTDERRYPWGNEFKSVPIRLNFYDAQYSFMDDGYPDSSPVGIYPEGMSPYGVMDMAGNAWEWTGDWYAPLYKKRVGVITENPTGALGGDGHVYRGGSYNSSFLDFRTTERRLSDDPRVDLGWRCVVNP